VLVHAFPGADIPVVQLSLDSVKPLDCHLDLGTGLAPLRDSGVLIVGEGRIAHGELPTSWPVRPGPAGVRFSDPPGVPHRDRDRRAPVVRPSPE